MTATEFAERIGMDKSTVWEYIQTGKIQREKSGGKYVIDPEEGEKFGVKLNRPNNVREYVRRLTAYNKKHGTIYSYGQRVAMDII